VIGGTKKLWRLAIISLLQTIDFLRSTTRLPPFTLHLILYNFHHRPSIFLHFMIIFYRLLCALCLAPNAEGRFYQPVPRIQYSAIRTPHPEHAPRTPHFVPRPRILVSTFFLNPKSAIQNPQSNIAPFLINCHRCRRQVKSCRNGINIQIC
jgi:hypothetical protein